MRIDLQLHSTYSDGYLTPTELVQFMNKKGVRVAAITDHNTVGGVNEFKIACKKYGIKPIVGVELYAKFGNRRINLVWYNINEFNPCLHDMLRESQIRRRRRIRWSLEKLVDLGFKIKINKVLDQYTHYVPINHVVDDIMAVPHNLKKNRIELKKMGIDGVEVLSPHHSLGAIMHIQILARELNWIETGGSDFHRFEGGRYPIQKSWDYFKIDSEYLIGVKKIIGI